MRFPHITNVVVDRRAEAGFRRRALNALPVEHLETLWGNIRGCTAYIHVFMPIDHKGTPGTLDYEQDDLTHQEEEAREAGLHLLGTIHTHPGTTDTGYSETDAGDSEATDDVIFGICAVDLKESRRKTCIAYWPGVQPLGVTYTKQRCDHG
jgi:hypothetical protein